MKCNLKCCLFYTDKSKTVAVFLFVWGFLVPEMVQCFSIFDPTDGTCGDILGQVPLDDCCMNPTYGYLDKDSVCKSCR